MKKSILFMMLAPLCTVSHAQINPKMSALFDKLASKDRAPIIIKTGGQGNPTRMSYSVHLYHRPDLYHGDSLFLDSLLREERSCLTDIRRTLDELQEEAQESYHYEYHCGGRDTIIYSMNLSHDTTWVTKLQQENHPHYYSKEFLSLNFHPAGRKEGAFEGRLEYTISLPQDTTSIVPYTQENLTVDIAQLFKQHRIKPRKARWEHDEAYSDSVKEVFQHYLLLPDSLREKTYYQFDWGCTFEKGSSIAGVTDATIYTVPIDQELLALQLLAAFDSLALKYTESPQKHYFQYTYGHTFDGTSSLFLLCLDAVNHDTYYILDICNDEFGYHFLVAQTEGTLWEPLCWSSLKTIINGKKTFFKGMKPKWLNDWEEKGRELRN